MQSSSLSRSVPTTVSSRDFVVAEQNKGSFTPHIFESEADFKEWRQNNRSLNIVARSSARGNCNRPVDHRNDWLTNF